jgi:hypothetical protein
MKIKRDEEVPSTIIACNEHGERYYWTGEEWTENLFQAKRYRRATALEKASKKKTAFVITIGFNNN